MNFRCYIEFAPRAMNREELKRFEKHCRADAKTRLHFDGVKGRTYFFRFPSESARQSFLHAVERQLAEGRYATRRQDPDLWQPLRKQTPRT